MTARDRVGELVTQHGLRGGAQAFGVRETAFVDVEIEADPELTGGRHQRIVLTWQIGIGLGKTAERGRAVASGQFHNPMGITLGEGAEIAETDGLKMDAPLPLVPELLQRCVSGLSHRAGSGVDVAAQRVGPMGMGAAEREVGPPIDVGFGDRKSVV